MGETRVNLKHLLEDIRDGYPYPPEEVIITELIANALDSKASVIRFLVESDCQTISIIDNGEGMTSKNLEKYHDIAATTKMRGKGIGFAGLGAKLSLLVAKEVMTETKRGSFHKATRWRLESTQRAPWEYVEPTGLIDSNNGTAVSILLCDKDSPLLDPNFVERVIQVHFFPLLHNKFREVLKYIYEKEIHFWVNDRIVQLPKAIEGIQNKPFIVKGGRGKLIGIGFLGKSKEALPEGQRGLAISTYGKVIKRGWDWIGISPRNPANLTGIVEVPLVVEILTTNKADFLQDINSKQKYYRYRKAIQKSIEPVLRELGEINTSRERPERKIEPLEKEIDRVLEKVLDDFPELNPLLGKRRKGEKVDGVIPDSQYSPVGKGVDGVDTMTGTKGGSGEGAGIEATEGENQGERIEQKLEPTEPGRIHIGRKKRPGLMIGFDDDPNREDLGWLLNNTIWINEGHPAYKKAKNSGAENYHIVFSIAWVLSNYLEESKSPQIFIGRFLSSWGGI